MGKFIFTWDKLTYWVNETQTSFWKPSKRKKLIIDGVSGYAFAGSVIAIMGESGSGKSTLLTLLSGQRRGKGVLRINGRVITGKILGGNSAFVQQKDLFTESLTVHEHMTFMAAMCLNKPYSARNMVINKLLKDLSIENLKYTTIDCLSTGERRKLSLASNLLLEPYILFCDEPTTGLDSFNAISVVKILETIAFSGKIVFLTVHQPSSMVFNLFDNIILLSTNGKVVFQGSKQNAARFFESQQLFCPSSYNPADFYIKHIVVRSSLDENKIQRLTEAFNEEYAVKFNFANLDYNALLLKQRSIGKNFFYTLGWLTWRILIDMKRHSKQYAITFLLIVVIASIIGISYASTTIKGQSSVQNIQGALLLMVSELIFNGMYQVINVFPSEIEIFMQEKNIYAPFPYFLSKIVSLVPFSMIYTFGFLAAYFIFLSFLHGFQTFMQMYLILFQASLGGSALGLSLSALFPTVEYCHLFIVPLELLCLLLSGLWIKIDTLPKFFAIAKYFSPFYVSFESICIVYWLKVDSISNCTEVTNIPCFRNGSEVLIDYDFIPNYDKVSTNCMYGVVLIAVYCYIGYIGILRKRALYHI